jgi:hypothetical protein
MLLVLWLGGAGLTPALFASGAIGGVFPVGLSSVLLSLEGDGLFSPLFTPEGNP